MSGKPVSVLYTGAVLNSSGYAEAARNYVAALAKQPGINLSVQPVSFENWQTDIGSFGEIIVPLLNKSIQPDVQIIHLTPENFPRYILPGIKNIGYTVWETSKLPDSWVPLINQLDEVWVPSTYNIEVFRSSGIKIPVKKIPHTINLDTLQVTNPDKFDVIPTDKYLFYSVFQWSARKNPEGLLKAYLTEFRSDESVCLVLKTYLNNNTTDDRNKTVQLINQIKHDLQLRTTPQIVLLHGILSNHQILSLHKTCNCFVLPNRSEGFGVPHFEAAAFGNPVITTNFGGVLEFLSPETSWLTKYHLTPVSGMGRPTYSGDQDWAEPSIYHLKQQMRWVFSNQQEAKSLSQKDVEKLGAFSWESIGKLMMENL